MKMELIIVMVGGIISLVTAFLSGATFFIVNDLKERIARLELFKMQDQEEPTYGRRQKAV